MAAAVPAVVPVVVNNNAALPAAILEGLLTKYKFIPTRLSGETEVYFWQEKDPQFRCQPVHCTGYCSAHNTDGTVYVNSQILSMLSEAPVLGFDSSRETFNAVMTFVHSMHRSNRTNAQLLELLPLVRRCKLAWLFDAISLCLVRSEGVPFREAFAVGLQTESFLLAEYCLKNMDSAVQLGHLMTATPNVFRARPQSAFLAEVSARVAELMTILPPFIQPGAAEDPRRVEFKANYDALYASLSAQVKARWRNNKETSPFWDIQLTFAEEEREVFASSEILAHASRFFLQTFYGGFASDEKEWLVPVEGVHVGDYAKLVLLLLPTVSGLLWRVTASAPSTVLEQQVCTFRCQFMYRRVFRSDSETLLRVLKLAVYYQMPGLVDYLIDVVLHCLPWRERLRFADADTLKSREIMASLLTQQTVEKMRGSEDHLEDISASTKHLLIEFFAHLFVF